jgi:hypothetical protein
VKGAVAGARSEGVRNMTATAPRPFDAKMPRITGGCLRGAVRYSIEASTGGQSRPEWQARRRSYRRYHHTPSTNANASSANTHTSPASPTSATQVAATLSGAAGREGTLPIGAAFSWHWREVVMRTLITLAAVGGISCFAAGASAQPLSVPRDEPIMQQADWYCGPECQRHRYWEQRRAARREQWRESRQYPYRYSNNGYYSRGY